jgi:hypothetical protein
MDFRFDLCVLGECIKTGSSHLPFVKLVLHQENYQSWEINGSRKGGQKKLGRTIGTSVFYFLSFRKIFSRNSKNIKHSYQWSFPTFFDHLFCFRLFPSSGNFLDAKKVLRMVNGCFRFLCTPPARINQNGNPFREL